MNDDAAPGTPPITDTPQVAVEDSPSKGKSRTRSILSVVVGTIAVISLIVSVTALWARAALFDSQNFADKVTEVIQQPEVAQATAAYLTEQLFVLVDANTEIDELIPPILRPLQATIRGGAEQVVEKRFTKILENVASKEVLHDLIERSHATFIKLLKGDGLVDGLSVENGEVSINLLPLMSRGLQRVQDAGLFSDLQVPELTAEGDPAQQIADLEAALGRDLPDDFGQLVVYQSDRLAEAGATLSSAQQAVALAKRALILAIVLTFVGALGCILLAHRRRRATVALLVSSAAVLLITRAVVRRVMDKAPDLVSGSGAKAAITSTVESLTSGLFSLITTIVILALLVCLVLYLTGSSKAARSLRGAAGSSDGSVTALVAAHRGGSAIALVGVAVILLVLAGINTLTIVVALALVVAAGVALWSPLPGTEAAKELRGDG